MATLKGKAVIWAVNGITFSAGISVAGTENALFQSLGFERTGDDSYVKDSAGEDISAIYANQGKLVRMTVIPGGTAIADARSLTDKFLPTKGTLITIADTETTIVDGTYNCKGASLTRSVDNALAIELTLESRDTNNITTVVS
jgi:hypothetical protein